MTDETNHELQITAADLFPKPKRAEEFAPAPETAEPIDVDEDDGLSPAAPVARSVPRVPSSGPGVANVLHARVVTGCGGGPEKTILRSPRYSDRTRYNILAAYLYPQGDPGMCVIRQTARDQGCPLYEIAERYALDHHSVGAMLELCRELKVDIWHGHDYKSNLLGLLLKRFHKMKLVTTAHGFTRETWRTRLYYHLDNLAMLGYDHVIAVSPKLLEHCARHGVNPDRLTYIPNAIDTAEYRRTQPAADAKAELGLPADRFTIGVIGRFSPEKGVDRAIRMVAQLRAELPFVELHLIGDGPQREELQALASRLGVMDAIRWWGWQQDTRPIYEAMDALLLPSRTEGLPNVVLEAMAMGVPVAATDVGGVRDLLDNGDCGIVLNDDENTWARRVQALVTRPTLADSYADLACQRVGETFSFRKRMDRVMSVYDRVLGRGGIAGWTDVRSATPMGRAA